MVSTPCLSSMREAVEESGGGRSLEIPPGWRQQCSQGHRSGLARKCKQNNHDFNYLSPDGTKFDDLESVYKSLYSAMGNIWQNSPTLEELDESQIQKKPRTELAGKPKPASGR